METLVYNVIEAPRDLATLTFYTRGSWASVNLGWTVPDWEFTGWYVNFERPYAETPYGLRTMDLIVDLLIDPTGTPQPKDAADYTEAVNRGILDPAPEIDQEQADVLRQLSNAEGPFARSWTTWRPNHAWPDPALPPEFRAAGAAWTTHESG